MENIRNDLAKYTDREDGPTFLEKLGSLENKAKVTRKTEYKKPRAVEVISSDDENDDSFIVNDTPKGRKTYFERLR